MAKRPKQRIKKARVSKRGLSRVKSKKRKHPTLAKLQQDPTWKKKSKKVKWKQRPALVSFKPKKRRKAIPEHFKLGKKRLRARLYFKLDEFAKRKKRKTSTVGYSMKAIILADADFGMSNPAIDSSADFNLQYWTTPVCATKAEAREALITMFRDAMDFVEEYASFEVLKCFLLTFHMTKKGTYSVKESGYRTPADKYWRPE